MSRATGIDVSGYQPSVAWNKVYDSGVRFAGIKASEGDHHVDSALRAHRDGFRQLPFLLGFYYHFADHGDPARQADLLMDSVGPLRAYERLCCDFERLPVPGDPAASFRWLDAFYVRLMAGACTDRRPLIYTSSRIWRQLNDAKWDLASEVDLWVPRYSSDGSEPKPPAPWATAGWSFWQWTDGGATGPVHETPGVGRCDANFFKGDESMLAAYARLASS